MNVSRKWFVEINNEFTSQIHEFQKIQTTDNASKNFFFVGAIKFQIKMNEKLNAFFVLENTDHITKIMLNCTNVLTRCNSCQM